jgi:hypothetical protein
MSYVSTSRYIGLGVSAATSGKGASTCGAFSTATVNLNMG